MYYIYGTTYHVLNILTPNILQHVTVRYNMVTLHGFVQLLHVTMHLHIFHYLCMSVYLCNCSFV